MTNLHGYHLQHAQLSTVQQNKKDAIYAGLQSVLSADQAVEVLAKWSNYFDGTGSIFSGLNSFSRDVCLDYGIADQQRELLRALRASLLAMEQAAMLKSGSVSQLAVRSVGAEFSTADTETAKPATTAIIKPVASSRATTNTHATTVPIANSAEYLTFQSLLLEILALLAKHEKDHDKNIDAQLQQFLVELVDSMPWSDSQQQQLLALIKTGNTSLVRSYLPDQLKAFLKHLRSWIEGEIGTAAAGKLINQAITSIQSLPVNAKYSAKKLI